MAAADCWNVSGLLPGKPANIGQGGLLTTVGVHQDPSARALSLRRRKQWPPMTDDDDDDDDHSIGNSNESNNNEDYHRSQWNGDVHSRPLGS